MPKFISDADMQKLAAKEPKKFLSDDEMTALETAAPETLDEMHPDFTTADRLVVKNLGNDLDSSIAYLQQKHPTLEITQDSGEIVARKPGENAYRKLDPGGWTANLNPVEFARDVGDIGYDVASALGTTAATAAGGLAGNLPGAAAAGAASSGSLEALRQKIGQALGVNQGVNLGDVALSTTVGAASPLLFGSGASVAQAAGQSLKEAGKRTAEQIYEANQGALMRLAPKVGSAASGIGEDIINTAYKNLPFITSLDETGVKNFSSATQKKAAKAITDYRRGVGSQMGEVINETEGVVDVGGAREAVENLAVEMADTAEEIGSDAAREPLNELKQMLNKYFKRDVIIQRPTPEGGISEEVTKQNIDYLAPKDAWSLMKSLEDYAEKYRMDGSGFSRHQNAASVSDKRIMDSALESAQNIRSQIDDLSGGRLGELSGQYAEAKNLEKELRTFVKDPRSTYRNLSNVLNPPNRILYETLSDVDQRFNTGLIEDAKKLAAYKAFSKAPWLGVSAGGTTSTSRTVPAALAGGSLGYYAGAQSGMGQGAGALGLSLGTFLGSTVGSPAAMRRYIQTTRNAKFLEDQARKLSGGQPVAKTGLMSIWNAMNSGGE